MRSENNKKGRELSYVMTRDVVCWMRALRRWQMILWA